MTDSLPRLTPSTRVRRTPFSRRVEAAGVSAYSIYNHMLLPTEFRSVEDDYRHLLSAVQLWDVSAQRQVEITGPDAQKLVQMSTPRDLSTMADNQCYYIPAVDENGGLLNDPVLVRLASDRFRVSLADSDLLHYYKGLANGFALDVDVFEADVFPLAVQGPLSNRLMGRVFGDEVTALESFRHRSVQLFGRATTVARSGWSHQAGFEIYLEGSEHGEALWDMLSDAGADLDVRAGCPNSIERIMSGLLSYGGDVTLDNTPFEAGLGRYCNLSATLCLGHAALAEKSRPMRQIRAVEIPGDPLPAIGERWPTAGLNHGSAGFITSAAWSPDVGANVAIGMIESAHWSPGTELVIDTPEGPRAAFVRSGFWS